WARDRHVVRVRVVVHPGPVGPYLQTSWQQTCHDKSLGFEQLEEGLQRNAGIEVRAAVFELDEIHKVRIKVVAQTGKYLEFRSLHVQLQQMHVLNSGSGKIAVEADQLDCFGQPRAVARQVGVSLVQGSLRRDIFLQVNGCQSVRVGQGIVIKDHILFARMAGTQLQKRVPDRLEGVYYDRQPPCPGRLQHGRQIGAQMSAAVYDHQSPRWHAASIMGH